MSIEHGQKKVSMNVLVANLVISFPNQFYWNGVVVIGYMICESIYSELTSLIPETPGFVAYYRVSM